MDPQTIFLPAKPKVSRARRQPAAEAGPVVAAPALVAASFDRAAGTLTLAFDRAVGIAGLASDQVLVDDPGANTLWVGTGAGTLLSPSVVRVDLVYFEVASGATLTLTAPGTTGIVAADGGLPWAGAVNVALPFP